MQLSLISFSGDRDDRGGRGNATWGLLGFVVALPMAAVVVCAVVLAAVCTVVCAVVGIVTRLAIGLAILVT